MAVNCFDVRDSKKLVFTLFGILISSASLIWPAYNDSPVVISLKERSESQVYYCVFAVVADWVRLQLFVLSAAIVVIRLAFTETRWTITNLVLPLFSLLLLSPGVLAPSAIWEAEVQLLPQLLLWLYATRKFQNHFNSSIRQAS